MMNSSVNTPVRCSVNYKINFERKKAVKSNFWCFFTGMISIGGFFFIACVINAPQSIASEDSIIASAKHNIQITQKELDHAVKIYQQKTRKPITTKEEKIKLAQNLIRRHLILQQEETKTYRNKPQIRQQVKSYEDSLVINKYLNEKIGRRLTPTEQQLKDYYQKNRSMFGSPAKVEARHILLRTRPEAEKILQRLKRGEDFILLAKDYSIDLPLAREGGQMARYPIPKGEAVKQLDQTLFMLAEGEVSDIVETDFGFHIIRVDKIFPPSFKPFEEVQNEIKKHVTQMLHNKAYEEMTSQLEKSAEILIFEDKIK